MAIEICNWFEYNGGGGEMSAWGLRLLIFNDGAGLWTIAS